MKCSQCGLMATCLAFVAMLIVSVHATDEPLGRNYRKNGLFMSNAHNNGKIPSGAESKVTAISLRPGQLSSEQLKTSASDNKDSFSIGLGVLSPSYSQKFGEDGKTKLDFNSDQGGFSYSLTNVVHPSPSNQPAAGAPSAQAPAAASPIASKVQSEGFIPSAYYNNQPQANPQVNIYHKQTADPSATIYGRMAAANQYPAPPAAQNTANPAGAVNAAAAYSAAQQAAFGNYAGYSGQHAAPAAPAPTAAAPSANPLANFPAFASGLTDAEKSFLQTVPQVAAPQAAPGQYPSQPLPQPTASGYPGVPSPQISPYASSPYAAQHVHSAPNTYSPNTLPAAPTAAPANYAQGPAPQAPQPSPNPYAPFAAASSTQPKLVSQQQLTANPNPNSMVPNAQSPYGGNSDPFMNPYMAAAASMYNPAYANLAASASSAYPSMSPYDLMGDFMY